MIDLIVFTLGDADPTTLSPDELARAARFVDELARRRFVAARAGLRGALAARLHADPAALVFSYGPAGKPFLPAAPRLGFNLAHSADLAVIAVARIPDLHVGVDLERIRPLADLDRLAARLGEGPPPTLEHFFRSWTRREALLKALGLGVAELALATLPPGWTQKDLALAPGFAAALVSGSDP